MTAPRPATPQAPPTAFLALWNSIAGTALQAEYETWHSIEHVPERVGLPGFLRAQRYRTLDPGSPAATYFTCYWLVSLDALATPGYQDVMAHPTRWSARMRQALTDFHRLPCALQGSVGAVQGRYVVPLPLAHAAQDAAHVDAALDAHANTLVRTGAVLRAHWGQARHSDDFPLANAAVARPPARVVLLTHLDAQALRQATGSLIDALAPWASPVQPVTLYECLTDVRQAELPPATAGSAELPRQAPREDLMARFARPTPDGDQPA